MTDLNQNNRLHEDPDHGHHLNRDTDAVKVGRAVKIQCDQVSDAHVTQVKSTWDFIGPSICDKVFKLLKQVQLREVFFKYNGNHGHIQQ